MAYVDVSTGVVGDVTPPAVRVSAVPSPPRKVPVTDTAGPWRLLSWSWADGNAVAALEFLERSRDVANESVSAIGVDTSLHR